MYCGRFEHSRFAQVDCLQINLLTEVFNTQDALIERKGRTAEVVLLDISDIPDLAAVLRGVAEGLGGEAKAGPTNAKQ